jgi:hypothetical protein
MKHINAILSMIETKLDMLERETEAMVVEIRIKREIVARLSRVITHLERLQGKDKPELSISVTMPSLDDDDQICLL